MSIRRHLPAESCRLIVHSLAIAGLCLGGVGSADQPTTVGVAESSQSSRSQSQPVPPANLAAPIRSGEATGRIELVPPGNSTLEIRVARRPWLLEKLSGKKTTRSQKMNPPRPPADFPDPPSMSRIVPEMPSDIPNNRMRSGSSRKATAKSAPTTGADSGRLVDPARPKSQQQPPADAGDAVREVQSEPQPLKEPVASSPSELENQPVVVEELDVETQLNSHPDQVIVGEVIPPVVVESVEISDKQIETKIFNPKRGGKPSGSLANQIKAVEPGSDQSDPQPDNFVKRNDGGTTKEPSTTDEVASSSQHVGDLPEPVQIDAAITELSEPELDYTGHPVQPIRLTRSSVRMRRMMQSCLRYYYNRPEIANERSNWGMMHAIMVYGIDTRVIVGRERYSAIAWIAGNNACRGQKLLTEEDGKIVARNGVGLQGHQAQLLTVLALAGVPRDYELYAGDTAYTVQDLIESEQLACQRGEELTFTLIGLSHYLHTDAQWRNSDGEVWNFEKLIREELNQPIVGAACGGTHRLMGFAHALRARRAEGLPITGQWQRADKYVQSFIKYTYRLQNRDGSMSTDWFEGREDTGELDRKVQTTGHMVEWLLTVTPDSQLQNPRLVSAIRFLLNSMYEERRNEWEIGPKGHALRSLAMYYERVYQDGPAWQSRSTAQRHMSTSSRR